MVWKTLILFQTAGKFIAVWLKNLDQHMIISYNLTHNWHVHLFTASRFHMLTRLIYVAVICRYAASDVATMEGIWIIFLLVGRGLIGSSWARSQEGPHQGGSSEYRSSVSGRVWWWWWGILSDEQNIEELHHQHSSATARIHHAGQQRNGGAASLHVPTGMEYSAAAGERSTHQRPTAHPLPQNPWPL